MRTSSITRPLEQRLKEIWCSTNSQSTVTKTECMRKMKTCIGIQPRRTSCLLKYRRTILLEWEHHAMLGVFKNLRHQTSLWEILKLDHSLKWIWQLLELGMSGAILTQWVKCHLLQDYHILLSRIDRVFWLSKMLVVTLTISFLSLGCKADS